ncbi:hypothetical protein C8R43DRAFT_1114893 [Mycena crocata]|nr:hypothetical protein C8R43DRAFT_1114893 [Mycena crocata]
MFKLAVVAITLLSQLAPGYAWGHDLRANSDPIPGVPCNPICEPLAEVAINATNAVQDCTVDFAQKYAQCLDCGVQLDPITVSDQAKLVQTSMNIFIDACKRLGHPLGPVTVSGAFKGFATTAGASEGAGQTVSQTSQSGATAAPSESLSNTALTSPAPSPAPSALGTPASSGGTTSPNNGGQSAQWTGMHVAITLGAVAAALLNCIVQV